MARAAKSTAENVLLNFDSFKKLKIVYDNIITRFWYYVNCSGFRFYLYVWLGGGCKGFHKTIYNICSLHSFLQNLKKIL